MIVETLLVGQLQTNCYLIADQQGGEAAIVDPGDEARRILSVAEAFAVRYVINTHAHFDHMAANADVVAATGAPVIATANPGCMMQLEAGLRRHNMTGRVVHVIELLDEAYRVEEDGQ